MKNYLRSLESDNVLLKKENQDLKIQLEVLQKQHKVSYYSPSQIKTEF